MLEPYSQEFDPYYAQPGNGGAWMEIDCQRCGVDYDIEPPPMPGQPIPACRCGHQFTEEDLQGASFYDDLGRNCRNPFGGV